MSYVKKKKRKETCFTPRKYGEGFIWDYNFCRSSVKIKLFSARCSEVGPHFIRCCILSRDIYLGIFVLSFVSNETLRATLDQIWQMPAGKCPFFVYHLDQRCSSFVVNYHIWNDSTLWHAPPRQNSAIPEPEVIRICENEVQPVVVCRHFLWRLGCWSKINDID